MKYFNSFIKFKSNEKLSVHTLSNYQLLKRVWKDWSNCNLYLPLLHSNQFPNHHSALEYALKWNKKFKEYLVLKKYALNYCGLQIKLLKAYSKWVFKYYQLDYQYVFDILEMGKEVPPVISLHTHHIQ